MKKYSIYILYNCRTQLYFYIGHTIKPIVRLQEHQRNFKREIIRMEIIQVIYGDKQQAMKVEKYWISKFNEWGFKLNNLCYISQSKCYKRNKNVNNFY